MMRANLTGTKTETRRMPKKNGKPRFAVGDIGYAQEAWRLECHLNIFSPLKCSPSAVYFEADDSWHAIGNGDKVVSFGIGADESTRRGGRVRASMHLPEKFTRFKFRVLECEFQKLHDITELQAIAEGVVDSHEFYKGAAHLPGRILAITAYFDLWEEINGQGSWVLNPMIERIRYERIPL
ncbi:MAG: hypothetical protein ACRCT6_02775 [Notoacmeibacter sp.]